jgi:uncharacterized protein YcnI
MPAFSETTGRRTGGHRPTLLALVAVVVGTLVVPAAAAAHAVVTPAASKPAEQQLYTLTVPNEREVPTVRVELQVPAEIDTILVGEAVGWESEVVRKDDRIDVIRFSGGSIPPDFFGTFQFIARNPVEEGELVWRVRQFYEGGEIVVWGGPPDSETPASRTEISESADDDGSLDTHGGGGTSSSSGGDGDEPSATTAEDAPEAAPAAEDEGGRDSLTLVLSLVALAAGVGALGVALRRQR